MREAINALAARGGTVVTLVSDVRGSKRMHYAGIDNSSAGRTTASPMGRFRREQGGKVGLIAGSLALRDHIERPFGFEQVLAYVGFTWSDTNFAMHGVTRPSMFHSSEH